MESPAIIRFFIEEKHSRLLSYIGAFIVVTGLASIVLIGLINEVAFGGLEDKNSLLYYASAMLLYALGTRFLNIQVTTVVERQLLRIRLRIMEKIRHLDFIKFEKLGREEVHLALSQEVVLVSNSADMLVSALQQAVMLLFCMVYVAWLSPIAFAIVIVAIITTYLLISNIQSILSKNFHKLSNEESQLFNNLDHLVNGFKEVRLNAKKSDAIYDDYRAHVIETERLKVDNRKKASWSILMSHLFMYTLLGAIIFGLPVLVDGNGGLVGKLVATVLFIITPLLLILEGIPTIERANASLDRIYALEKKLSSGATPLIARQNATPEFSRLELQDIEFSYFEEGDTPVFSVGPISLTIKKGELLFITGGNGSGKSTLLKLLSGLYLPDSGLLSLNGQLIDQDSAIQLREQYGAVFSDFHLFGQFYGLSDIDTGHVETLIKKMGLEGKVVYDNGRFSTLSLSTGQRKRLALIIALLDDRDIYIFDEWASDQDVHFREYFYAEILPELKSLGKTIIAVTHDDRYWHLCDRLVKLELGKIQKQERVEKQVHENIPEVAY